MLRDPRVLRWSLVDDTAVIDANDVPPGVCRSIVDDNIDDVMVSPISPVHRGPYPCDRGRLYVRVSMEDLHRNPAPARREITKRHISHYPHTCPWCGGRAYVGGGPKDIDCERKCR